MAKDQAPSAPVSGRGGRNIGRGAPGKPPARGGGQTAVEAAAKPAFNPARWVANAPKFIREVRAEARKTTWTTPKETWITSVMVFIMVVMATLFFFFVDWGISQIVQWVIKIGA